MAVQISLDELGTVGKWKGHVLEPPEDNLMMGMVSISSTEGEVASQYYISDTDMIERRFLKDATETFEEKREVDPFAECKLYDTYLECVYDYFGIQEVVSKVFEERIAKGDSNPTAEVSFEEIVRGHPGFKSNKNRISALLEKEVFTDFEKVNILNLLDIRSFGIIVIECKDTFATTDFRSLGKVLWIREVADGFLGIVDDVENLIENGVWKEYFFDKSRISDAMFHCPVRQNIANIKKKFEELNIPSDGCKTKKDYVERYFKHAVRPERFLYEEVVKVVSDVKPRPRPKSKTITKKDSEPKPKPKPKPSRKKTVVENTRTLIDEKSSESSDPQDYSKYLTMME